MFCFRVSAERKRNGMNTIYDQTCARRIVCGRRSSAIRLDGANSIRSAAELDVRDTGRLAFSTFDAVTTMEFRFRKGQELKLPLFFFFSFGFFSNKKCIRNVSLSVLYRKF